MWHNEENSCDGVHDQLDWMRMRGAWGEDGKTIFGKTDTPGTWLRICANFKSANF